MTTTYYTTMDSPLGPLLLTSNGQALTSLTMEQHKHGAAVQPDWLRDDAPFAAVCEQLSAYFANELQCFDLPLQPSGTKFQQQVWQALLAIPFGQTQSYGELARSIGNPKASRAVGLANGRNPISIIIPCHRVIGANGSLTGYGGGIERKRWLLDHESGASAQQALF